MGIIEYHLKELKIALDKNDDRHILPNILDSDKIILDIGCGIGQSLIALNYSNKLCIGIDINEEVIKYGIDHYGNKIQFILARAEYIPLPSNTLDLVYSRVALPYTNIPKAIKEMRRVLRNNGRIWMTLHQKKMVKGNLRGAIKSIDIARLIHGMYVLINGYIFKYFGIVIPFINGKYESWQNMSAMKRLLIRNGFEVAIHKVDNHTIIEGNL